MLLLGAPDATAQIDDRAGTAAMEELLVPVTPRTVGMGTALTSGLANVSPLEAVQSNPAATMTGQGTSAMFSRSEYLADIGVNYFGIAQRFGNNMLTLSINSWDYGDIAETDEFNNPDPVAGVTYTAGATVVGASLARQFTDRIAAGFTVKGLNRTIAEASAFGIGLDAGMTYVVGESGLRFGVALKNFGTKLGFSGSDLDYPLESEGPDRPVVNDATIVVQEDELPSQLTFGGAYTRQFAQGLSATVLANFESNAYDLDQYAAGLELGYQNLFFVRGGVDINSDISMNAWSDWNVGAGFNLPVSGTQLMVDYAYRPTEVFDGVHMYSLSVQL